jgi:hypothetical protein
MNKHELKEMDKHVKEFGGDPFRSVAVMTWRACSAYRDEQEKAALSSAIGEIVAHLTKESRGWKELYECTSNPERAAVQRGRSIQSIALSIWIAEHFPAAPVVDEKPAVEERAAEDLDAWRMEQGERLHAMHAPFTLRTNGDGSQFIRRDFGDGSYASTEFAPGWEERLGCEGWEKAKKPETLTEAAAIARGSGVAAAFAAIEKCYEMGPIQRPGRVATGGSQAPLIDRPVVGIANASLHPPTTLTEAASRARGSGTQAGWESMNEEQPPAANLDAYHERLNALLLAMKSAMFNMCLGTDEPALESAWAAWEECT